MLSLRSRRKNPAKQSFSYDFLTKNARKISIDLAAGRIMYVCVCVYVYVCVCVCVHVYVCVCVKLDSNNFSTTNLKLDFILKCRYIRDFKTQIYVFGGPSRGR